MFVARYSPSSLLSHMNRLSQEMDRAFGAREVGGGASRMVPPLNLWSDENHLYVELELPGFALNDLEILVTGGNQLSIKGHRDRPAMENVAWLREERSYGQFNRVLELPELVDSERVEAEFKNGVLTVTLPKREEAKPRRIEVKAAR